MSSIISLFPSSVYHARLTSSAPTKLNRELKSDAVQLSQVDQVGLKWSAENYPGGYTSYGSMDQLHRFSTSFEELKRKIDLHVRKFAKHLEMHIDADELQMGSCWVNVMPTSVVHTMHLHPLSVISGTYYVDTPVGSSPLKFEDPRMSCFMASPPRKPKARTENQRFFQVKPKAGDLVLFESWMRHEVPPQRGEKERISVSFNYDWVNR